MHPAYSVIGFTAASGAGYGLLIWMAIAWLTGQTPASVSFVVLGLGLAIVLVTGGLLSSLLHLGRPERAWRALSQWQSSWLSREGVGAVATYVPIAALGLGWLFADGRPFWLIAAAVLTIVGALVTVWCTGMIYASLSTIREWAHPLVAPLYVILAIMTGGILFNVLIAAWSASSGVAIWGGVFFLICGWFLKVVYWTEIDRFVRTKTAADATGLGRFGEVRVLEPAHTQPNFVMREMGYQIARKHVESLRQLATACLFIVPSLCLIVLFAAVPWLAAIVSILAVASGVVGVLTERWLFFAEARHMSMLYYGLDAA
ncbi:MAG: dimethyl sulfoxide reductase anchor subunit family protein [Hyphomicrobiaceae bacterium]